MTTDRIDAVRAALGLFLSAVGFALMVLYVEDYVHTGRVFELCLGALSFVATVIGVSVALPWLMSAPHERAARRATDAGAE